MISWENIEKLEDHFITYLLYKESKTVSQISKIRNISCEEVNDHLIKAKFEVKAINKDALEKSKDILDKYLELGKDHRLEYISNIEEQEILNFKRKLYKRIFAEKNAEDLIALLWTVGELKDDKFLDLLHKFTNHRHSDVRRITYSALRKISSKESLAHFHKGLYDSNAQTRQYCAKAIGIIGNDNSLEILSKLVQTKKLEKPYVKKAYLEAIQNLKEKYSS